MSGARDSRLQAAIGLFQTGVVSATVFVVWLALTLAFMVGGVTVVGTGVTTLGQSHAFASVLVAVVGVLAVSGISPALAGLALAAAVKRGRGVLDHDLGVVAVLDAAVPCEFGSRARCESACDCCC